VTRGRLGFIIREGEIRGDVLVPKYYDPEIERDLAALTPTHDLVPLGDLIAEGAVQLRQGNYVGKIHYGTGTIPYIRTSDIANWELRGSPKHGVSDAVAAVFRAKQSVAADDVLLVHEGTYLIGSGCLLTAYDTDIIYQHHLARLRVLAPDSRLSGPLLMCALLSEPVQRQIRSKQFTADVIDSIVGRLPEVRLPLPKRPARRVELTERARALFAERAEARLQLAVLRRGLDTALAAGSVTELLDQIADAPTAAGIHGVVGFLGSAYRAQHFLTREGGIRGDILLPRYYDPVAEDQLEAMRAHNDLRTVGDLVRDGIVELATGDEVGKLAYGTGSIPFVRTSDLGNWELKQDPKQRVSEAVYAQYAHKQGAAAGDILLVRDGTYLVGSSAMVTEEDLPFLFSGGLYRIRVRDRSRLDPYLLLALLNTQVAGRQMRNKQFTRDVIDTLGRRLEEVVLPVPKDAGVRAAVTEAMESLITRRVALRAQVATLGAELLRP
jgi:hypothetical protein